MKGLSYAFLFLILAVLGCDDCNNCEPFTEEPNVLVRFYNYADSTNQIIIIDSVNNVDAGTLRHFQDTTYTFRFPLDMTEDISEFRLIYRKASNPDSVIYNQLSISYYRDFVRRDDNDIIVQCDLTGFQSDFREAVLICKDSTAAICISNDAKINIYN
jgi:hypothetical protein